MPFIDIVRSIYPYEAQENNELSFPENKLLCILEDADEGWYLARLLYEGDGEGLIPKNYVEQVKLFINYHFLLFNNILVKFL